MAGSIYKHKFQAQRRRKIALALFKTLSFLFLIWLTGLLWFVGFKPEPTDLKKQTKVDGIVVLTGGIGRVEAGINALNHGLGKRLLVSGVNATLNTNTILNAYDSSLEQCTKQSDEKCITLGRQALDTKGNAVETKNWAIENNFNNLMVITSSYHMRRALLELDSAAPELNIHPFIVNTQLEWPAITLEYSKYLYSLARYAIS